MLNVVFPFKWHQIKRTKSISIKTLVIDKLKKSTPLMNLLCSSITSNQVIEILRFSFRFHLVASLIRSAPTCLILYLFFYKFFSDFIVHHFILFDLILAIQSMPSSFSFFMRFTGEAHLSLTQVHNNLIILRQN